MTAEAGSARPKRHRQWLIVVIVAVLGLATGFIAARAWPGTPGNDSAEAGFARDMSSHHAQAVEMAMLSYGKTDSPQLRTLSYDIALTQQAQIGIMNTWLTQWHLLPTGPGPKMSWMPDGSGSIGEDGLMPGMASPEELRQLQASTGKDFDILYSQLMLRHHLGGIHMVDAIVRLTDDPEVSRLASSMKAGQQKEVAVLQDILAQLGAKPL